MMAALTNEPADGLLLEPEVVFVQTKSSPLRGVVRAFDEYWGGSRDFACTGWRYTPSERGPSMRVEKAEYLRSTAPHTAEGELIPTGTPFVCDEVMESAYIGDDQDDRHSLLWEALRAKRFQLRTLDPRRPGRYYSVLVWETELPQRFEKVTNPMEVVAIAATGL